MNQLRILILILSTSPLLLAQGTALPPQMEAVTIYRDADNWAHVFSTSEIAAYYGFGLAQMRDLPLTTARIFALASGELALHVGPGPAIQGKPNFHVGIDLRTRLWRIAEIANIQKANLPVDIRRLLAAYVAGINEGRLEWLAQAPQLVFNTEPLAYDLATVQRLLSRPVTLDDVLRHGVQINGLTAMNVADAMAESDDPGVKEDPLRTASNSFAVGVQASLENGPMTIADPHLAFEDLGQLRTYFAQISGGGASVAGISFPGFPAIAMGFNDKLSWAITSNNPDFVDVWKTSTAGNGSTFLYDGQQRPIIRKTVTIDVWDPTTNLISQQSHVISYAGRYQRPIVRELQNSATQPPTLPSGTIWYAGSTFDTTRSLWEFFIRLGQAKSFADAKTAFAMNVILANNFLFTDDQGNMGYVWTGRVPLRPAPTPGTDWSMIQDGSSSAYQWQTVHGPGQLPWEELPHDGGPTYADTKWLQCNSLPDTVRPGTTMDLTKYPEYMVHPYTTPLTWRQKRGRELFDSVEQLTAAQLRQFAIEDRDMWWRELCPLAEVVMDEFALWRFGNLAATFELLRDWDLSTAPDRAEPLITHLVWACYAREVHRAQELGKPLPSYADFSYPEQLPDLATFKSPAWRNNRRILASALMRADDIWRQCINPVMTNLVFPLSPWTPTPFAALPSTPAVWGTAHYIDMTPLTAPANVAAYPVAGSTASMLALGNTQITKPWHTILENVTILGTTGTLVNLPIDSGAHTLLQVTLRPNGPDAWFLEAIGPSEVSSDPARYRYVADFAAGNWRPFKTDLNGVSLTATSSDSRNVDVNAIAP